MTEELHRSRGDRYALSALKNKRATIASEIIQLERQIRHRKDMLVHVDATLRLLDPSIQVDSIPPKRPPTNINLFRQGELGRMIIDAIRRSGGEATAADITAAILQAGGHGEEAKQAVARRVRSNLAYQCRRGVATRRKTTQGTVWALKSD